MPDGTNLGEARVSAIADILERQRGAFRRGGFPGIEERRSRLDRLVEMLLSHEGEIVEALAADFGGRSSAFTRTSDILGAIGAIRYNRDSLKDWMRSRAIGLPDSMQSAGAWAELRHEPLGVVGVLVPWNGPVLLACLAAAGVFAAGNRLMLKPSELAPRASSLLARMFGIFFDESEAAVIEGDARIAAAFCAQPFDHLLFTGSPTIAKQVMRAAAENLVPVTLELGGKSPVIIGRSANLSTAIPRLAHGKLASCGQVCVTPDYALVPRGMARSIAHELSTQIPQLYPTRADNDDYPAIIDRAHVDRLLGLLVDARERGAEVIEVDPDGGYDPDATRKMPLYLVLDPTDDMAVMQEEIFGPILPIIEYDEIDDALVYIADRPHPLSAYWFGEDAVERERVLGSIATGSIVVNDVRCQIFLEQLPFGGVGASGMGRYRGHQGFLTFSNGKTVLHQIEADAPLAAQRPPYAQAVHDKLRGQIDALRCD